MTNKKVEIMEAYLQLLDEQTEKRITVNDIVKRCGVSRNTFYYYFSDIPSMLDEIQTRWAELVRLPEYPESVMDCLKPLMQYAKEHGQGLLRAYQTVSHERFLRDLDRMWETVVRRYIETRKEHVLREEDRELLIRFFKSVFVGMTLDWFEAGMSYDLVESGTRMYRLLKDVELRRQLSDNC